MGVTDGSSAEVLSGGGSTKEGIGSEMWNILFLSVIFFLAYSGRSITGPLLPSLERDLGLSYSDCGGLFVFLSLGYLVSLLGSGVVASLVGHRKTIISSAMGIGFALILLSASNSLWVLRVGLVAAGMAAGLYPPSGIASLTKLASPANWGRALGIHDMAPNLSIVAAPALASILAGWISWRGVYAIFGIFAILIGFSFIRFGPPIEGKGQSPNLKTLKQLLGKPSLWIMSLIFCLGAAGMVGIYNMLSLYLTSVHGFEASKANMIVAFSRIPGIGMAFIAGWVTDIIGPRKAIWIVLACSGLLSMLLGIESGTALIVVIFLQAAVVACFFPAGLAAVSQLFPFELRNLAIAIVATSSGFVGSGLIPALMGFLADRAMFNAGLIITGAIVLAGIPALIFIRIDKP